MTTPRVLTPEAGIREISPRPVWVPQDVPVGRDVLPAISTVETWMAYWRTKFGEVGAGIGATAFALLSARDSHPGDEVLDLAGLRRDPNDADRDDIQYIFKRLHVFDPKDQPVLNKMHAQILERRAQLVSLYAVHLNDRWIAVDDKGFPFAISGTAWEQAALTILAKFPDARMIRLLGDARFFAGREADPLNPDRRNTMAGFLFDPQAMILGGGLGTVEGGRLDLLPYQRILTRAEEGSTIPPDHIENWITLVQVALVLLAALAGKGGGGAPVMTGLPRDKAPRRFFDIILPQDAVWALQAAAATRGAGIPTIMMASSGDTAPARPKPTRRPPPFRPAEPSGSGYADRYRAVNRLPEPGTLSDGPSALTPAPAPSASPPPPPASKKAATVQKETSLPVPPPTPTDLARAEEALREMFRLCPIDGRGVVDTSPLRNGSHLTRSLRFSDGTVLTTEGVLRMHERAWKAHNKANGRHPAALEGSHRSERRLVDVFRQVAQRPDLRAMSEAHRSNADLALDVPRVRIREYGPRLRDVLQTAWRALETKNRTPEIDTVQETTVVARNGERTRLSVLMSRYWEGLKREFAKKDIRLPEGGRHFETADGFDLIHFSLFGRPRVRVIWGKNIRPVPLPMTAKEPLPDATTLPGILAILHKWSETPEIKGLDRFPNPPNGTTVVLFDGRTGRQFHYLTLMRDLHYRMALAKADSQVAPVLREIAVDADVIQNPASARKTLPHDNTRKSLLEFVRKYRGFPQQVRESTVTRRRGGNSEPVLVLIPADHP